LNMTTRSSDRPRRASLGDVVGASATLLVLCSVLGRKREPLREVEPEVIPPEPLTVVGSTETLPVKPEAVEPEPLEPEAVEPEPVEPEPVEPEPVEPKAVEPEPIQLAPAPPPAPSPAPAAPVRDAEPSDSGGDSPPSVSTEHWSCEIALWTDHDRGAFYARSFHRGEELIVAESPGFAVAGKDVEESAEAVAAYRSLCDDLVRMGWTREGNGPDWYGARFRRDFSMAALNASLTSRAGSAGRQY
jgi:hypothetical protein